MNILEIKNLKISFNIGKYQPEAIHNLSLELEKGNSLGLVGESGCGKSITAMSIINLLPSNAIIQSGEIIFENKDILKLSKKELTNIRGNKIALIPQDPMTSLNPLYTIGEQILEAVELHTDYKGESAKQIVIDALKEVQIPNAEAKYNTYPHQLSGGMRQRAIIAMALSCNSELLIADEPTTALDVTVQAQILKLIKDIQQKRKLSLILISHDLAVVYNMCDKIAVMYSGNIIEEGKTEKIFKTPIHPYTKALLNSMPENRNDTLYSIEGQPPLITEIIYGCKFHPRCPYTTNICKKQIPQLEILEDYHKSACFNKNSIN